MAGILEADTQAIEPDSRISAEKLDSSKLNVIEAPSVSTSIGHGSDTNLDIKARLESKFSDSYIMCASTQALVAGLSDSDLLGANTQSMSDSMVLGSATQVVGGSRAAVEGSVGVVDSMDLIGNVDDNTSSCDTSADDLLMLATQPVFKMPSMPIGNTTANKSSLELNPSPNTGADQVEEPEAETRAIAEDLKTH